MNEVLFRTFYLGRAPYAKILRLQQNLVKWTKENRSSANPTLLLLQHPPVYTVGYRNKQYTSEEQSYLEGLGADFARTNRGGLITFHGPGQLVAYPIFSMRQVPISVRDYLCKLEQISISICNEYGLKAARSPHTGVWINDKKVCAIGVNAQQRVFSHGIALNCNTELSWFSKIVPCGIEGKGVTSLSAETGYNVTVESVLPLFLKEFAAIFGWGVTEIERVHVTGDMEDHKVLQFFTNSNFPR